MATRHIVVKYLLYYTMMYFHQSTILETRVCIFTVLTIYFLYPFVYSSSQFIRWETWS